MRNVAYLHPIQFLLRRVLFVLGLVLLNHTPLLGVMLFFFVPTCYFLLYVVHERQWEDWRMNYLHIMNEGFLYVYGILMLCFTNFVAYSARLSLCSFFLFLFFV
jgi:hypothetical protein